MGTRLALPAYGTMSRMHADDAEVPLAGGNVGNGVVRVGGTVRRPAGPWSRSVDAFLRHLHEAGFRGAPRPLGFDEQGRHVLEYVEGQVAMPFDPGSTPGSLHRVGALIRAFHDASAAFTVPTDARWNVVIPPDSEDLVIHHDLAAWNLVRNPQRWVFIDWDNAGPGSRLWDFAYAAHGFVPLDPATPPTTAGERLAALADGYRLDDADRERLVGLLSRRAMSMHHLLAHGRDSGNQPWARLWAEGHGQIWRQKAEYAEIHAALLLRACL